MRMSSKDYERYPKTAKYIEFELIEALKMPGIRLAMRRFGELNSAQLRTALTWGHGPKVKVANLIGAYGEFTPNINSQELRIDRHDLVQPHERGLGWARLKTGGHFTMLGATLLHELTHWGDDQDGVQFDGEEGMEFEKAFFGKVMYPCGNCKPAEKRIRRNTRHSVGWL